MTAPARQWIGRVASALGLLAVVVGVPAALWALVGNPLPTAIPTGDEVAAALTEGDLAETTIWKALAAVCWVAWLQLTVAVVVEVVAVVHAHPAPPLPVPRAMQSVVGALVTAVAVGTVDAVPRADTAALAALSATDLVASGRHETDLGPPTTPGGDVVVVERGDTLWDLSGLHLGDPTRWPEIHERNEGEVQPDGLRLEDPDHIRPGWRLTLPEPPGGDPDEPPRGPTGADAASTRAPEPVATSPSVTATSALPRTDARSAADRADSAAVQAEAEAAAALARLEAARRRAREAPGDAPRVEVPDPAAAEVRPAAPEDEGADEGGEETHREEDGEEREGVTTPEAGTPEHGTPEAGTPGADMRSEAAAPTDGTGGLDTEGPPDAPSGDGAPEDDRDGRGWMLRLPAPDTWPDRLGAGVGSATVGGFSMPDHVPALSSPPSALGGAGLLAAGVLWTLEYTRRLRERRRRAGERPGVTDPAGRAAELELRRAGEMETLTFLDAGLRVLARRLGSEGRHLPLVMGLNVARELSVLFGTPELEAPDGCSVEDGGFSWVLARPDDLRRLTAEARDVAPPLPALVTLGHTASSQVLLNLAAAAVVAVRGPGIAVHEVLCSMALELATGPWSDHVRVVAVGVGGGLDRLPGLVAVDGVSQALAAVDGGGGPADAPGVSKHVVVLCAGHHDPADMHDLVERAAGRGAGGMTVVVAGDVAAAQWVVEVAGTSIRWLPVGVELVRHRLDEGRSTAVGGVLAAARELVDASEDTGETGETGDALVLGGAVDVHDIDAELRLLGTVDVVGGAAPLPRGKVLELVAYLGTHRRGAGSERIIDALWGESGTSPGALHSTVSAARRALGADAQGHPLLPPADGSGLYRLSPRLGTDLDRFVTHVEAARDRGDGPTAAAHLRHALELVRGEPFTVPGGEYHWVHTEAIGSSVVAEVTDAAHRLAGLYLDAGDSKGAWWATAQGLLASPGNEQLHRDRMRAADLSGDPDAVEQVMEELCRAIDIDPGEAGEVLHPRTLDLYARLSRRRSILLARS